MSVTQEQLKRLFHYNPWTGVVTRRVSSGQRGPKGHVLGSNGRRCQGYIQVRIEGQSYPLHRIIWVYVYGVFPDQIDHINGARDDNRIQNLRSVTNQENRKNCARHSNNKSGVTGVSWHTRDKTWLANIGVDGKLRHLGYFDDKKDAIAARRAAEEDHGFHTNHGRAAAN